MEHHITRQPSLLAADGPILALFAVDLLLALWARTKMPDVVPTHWGPAGNPDAMGPAWMNVWMPLGIGIAVYLLFLGFSSWAARTHFSVPTAILRQFRWMLALFFIVLHGSILLESTGTGAAVVPTVRILIPALLIGIASTFPKLPQNPFMGIRLPWTLADAQNWRRTHDRAAKVWYAGSTLLLLAAFLPLPLGMWAFLGVLLLLVAIPAFDSFLSARRNRPQERA